MNPTQEGPVHITVHPRAGSDRAGNGSTFATTTVVYDVTSPDVTITSGAVTPINAAFNVTVTFTEPTVGFTANDLQITNGSASFLTTSDNQVYQVIVTPAGDGEVVVRLPAAVVHDRAGNGNAAAADFRIHYDGSKPSVVLSTVGSTTNTPFVVRATFSENVTGLDMADFTVTNAAVTQLAAISGSAYDITVTPAMDGIVTVQLPAGQVQDAATNYSNTSNLLIISYDQTAPSVTIQTSAPATVNAPFDITVSFSEAVSGYDWNEIVLTNASYALISNTGTQYQYQITPLTDGPVTINVPAGLARDAAGNPNTAATELSLTADMYVPGVTLTTTAPSFTNAPIPVTATFSEAVTGFDITDLILDAGTVTAITQVNPYTYTFIVTPVAEDTVKIRLAANAAQDAAGNASSASNELWIIYDGTRPNVSMATTAASPVSGAFTVTATFTEDVTGFTQAAIRTDNVASVTAFTAVDAKTYTFIITPAADGNVTVYIDADKASDAAGNGNTTAASLSLMYDAAAPSAVISTTAGTYTRLRPIPYTITFSEAVTGFDGLDISVTNGTMGGFSAVSQSVYTFHVDPTAGQAAIQVAVNANVAQDQSGRGNTAAAAAQVNFDEERPEATMSSPNMSPITGAVTLAISISEANTGFRVGDLVLTNVSLTHILSTAGNHFFNMTPLADGPMRIELPENAFTDQAGNGNMAAVFERAADITRPGAAFTTSATSPVSAAFPVTLTFTEKMRDFDATDLLLDNATITGFASADNISWTFMVQPTSAGNVSVTLPANVATDTARLANTGASLAMVYDNVRPRPRSPQPPLRRLTRQCR